MSDASDVSERRPENQAAAGPPPQSPYEWTVAQVCEWGRGASLDKQTVTALDRNQLEGKYLLTLTDEEIREMLPLLGPRKEFTSALMSLVQYTKTSSLPGGDSPQKDSTSVDGQGGSSALALLQKCATTRHAAEGAEKYTELWGEIQEEFGEQLEHLDRGSHSPDHLFAVLSTGVENVRVDTTGPTIQELYDEWVRMVVSRTARAAYGRMYPEMSVYLDEQAQGKMLCGVCFDTDDKMMDSMLQHVRQRGGNTWHVALVKEYASMRWEQQGAENVGKFPVACFALQAMIASENSDVLSYTAACPIRGFFEAGRRCGLIPAGERLAVLTCPAGTRALFGDAATAVTGPCVRDNTRRTLIWFASEGEADVGNAAEVLLTHYDATTSAWPLTAADKVAIIQLLVKYETLTIQPGRSIAVAEVDNVPEGDWSCILSIVQSYPDIVVRTRPYRDCEHGTQDEPQQGAEQLTPDPTNACVGWVPAPWDENGTAIARVDPRLACTHDNLYSTLTCNDEGASMALLSDERALRTLCKQDYIDQLEKISDTMRVLPVRCMFTREPRTYTLVDEQTGLRLNNKSFHQMSAEAFAASVVLLKKKPGTDLSPGRPAKYRRKAKVPSQVLVDGSGGGIAFVQERLNRANVHMSRQEKKFISEYVPDTYHGQDETGIRMKIRALQQKLHKNMGVTTDDTEFVRLLMEQYQSFTARGRRTAAAKPGEAETVCAAKQGELHDDAQEDESADEDFCEQCDLSHDTFNDPLLFCEALNSDGAECPTCVHRVCRGLKKNPTWLFCEDHLKELHRARLYFREKLDAEIKGENAVTLKDWCVKYGNELGIGETTVRDWVRFDPGSRMKVSHLQGSAKTNNGFLRLWRNEMAKK